MTSSEIVSSIFFSGNKLFRMEELSVGSRSHLIHNTRFQVDHNTTRDVLTSARFAEKGHEGIITRTRSFLSRELTIRTYSMFKTKKFPTSISYLTTGLTNVD
jgi:hypothetical protein